MLSGSKSCFMYFLLLLIDGILHCHAWATVRHQFVVKEAPYTRLCKTKNILTVNGQFPGPTLYAYRGDEIVVDVYNRGKHNITIHWHGVRQPRNPWSDGPEYITQCPIQPGTKFSQKIIFSTEEGTIWWHAHSDWSRATVHGAIIVYPKYGTGYPFPKPWAEVPILLGEWWNKDVMDVMEEALITGGDPNVSDALTINGQPGAFYPCSKLGTYTLNVQHGQTYLLRIINAALNTILFFAIAKHNLTVVGADASYTKPLTTNYLTVAPGQSYDALLHADQSPDHRYYMAARAYNSAAAALFDNTTTTAVVQYQKNHRRPRSRPPCFPYLPHYNDTLAFIHSVKGLRSLANERHPISVPTKNITTHLISTVSINLFPCPNFTCEGANGSRLAASMNNISFVTPSIDILQSYYYYHITRSFSTRFPSVSPYVFNFTADILPLDLEIAKRGTEVKILEYGSAVELVFQGTNVVAGIDHPMHIHGYGFFVVGSGLENFDLYKDPLTYNLVDPPERNTAIVPRNGWLAIRFRADNPERHQTWGMDTVLLVKNGRHANETLLPPPPDMPPC
ncbi:hypothetical protein RHSIM_Rhsim07G0046000 [Rhododendron simsii]|uniref:Laccase n=1 Tax=Rhododendron simsii TaxID=118357 RepID=A0A834LFZ2_RHOSS|nr:hypothetical protein RHSIM_Rhsim07G0046000 [Rhododendron simsii]